MKNNNDKLHNIRHSLAHILASAVLEMFPKAQLGVGPVIENGFFYDFLLPRPLTPEDISKLEKRMRTLVKEGLPFERQEMSIEDGQKYFSESHQPFKVELIKDIEKHGTTVFDQIEERKDLQPTTDNLQPVSLYKTGNFTDLCRGGHVENTSEIDSQSFKLDKTSGVYWRGDQKNPQMQRIYGLAFETREQLEEYIKQREEAEKRDHKKLGPQLDLFTFSELVGSGLPLWTPKGTVLRDLLDNFVWELREARGYERVDIPHITKKELYEKSKHWDKFKDELFKIQTREGHIFAMKPMNCPHHTQIYDRKQWSYRELPQRYASTTKVYRDEQSGELAGIARVLSITQDDAHVFCRITQTEDEIKKVWDIVHSFYSAFGLKLNLRLSLRDPGHPEKYSGNKEHWDKAEEVLRQVAEQNNTEYVEALGEAAFYAPKLDFMATDSMGRKHQVATIQLDVSMPDSFDLTCINEKGEKERIVMIHAAIMGSIERFLAVLIEHFAGAFPVWLSPVQAIVLPISEKQNEYGEQILSELKAAGIRAEFDNRNESVGKKIREAEMQKIPYMLVVGDKEKDSESVSVRVRSEKDQTTMKLEEFVNKIQEEIKNRSL